MDRGGGGVAIIALGGILGICLLFNNLVIVPQIVRSRWYRASIASMSLAVSLAVIVVGIALAYVNLERDAIPVVENVGVGMIIVAASAVLASLLCWLGGLIASARAAKLGRLKPPCS